MGGLLNPGVGGLGVVLWVLKVAKMRGRMIFSKSHQTW